MARPTLNNPRISGDVRRESNGHQASQRVYDEKKTARVHTRALRSVSRLGKEADDATMFAWEVDTLVKKQELKVQSSEVFALVMHPSKALLFQREQ